MFLRSQSFALRLSNGFPECSHRTLRRTLSALGAALCLFTATPHVGAAATVFDSDLWGQQGEAWAPSSRLPDFSFAGYHAGDKALPTVPVKTNVKDFGARGDGTTDDTQAFQRAIAATNNGALYIPAGRYKLTNLLEITKSNLVLRGAGEGNTTLFMARSLKEIKGQVPYGGTALLAVRGAIKGQQLATVVAAAKRGERQLVLSSTAGLRAGQMIRLRMHNPADNSLGCALFANQGCLNAQRQQWLGGHIVDWAVQVQAVQGQTVTLVRPLRLEVRLGWAPTIWQHQPTVQEVGIEHLTLEFPPVQYGGHDHWAGYYGIFLGSAVNSWVRQVTIVDADRGIEIDRGGYNTVTDVTLTTKGRRGAANPSGSGTTGHYGFTFGNLTQDNLIRESDLQTRFDHNMAVAAFANGNVYSGLLSASGRLDHHAGAPYENLYTEIVLTETATDLLFSGGNRADEPNAGARTTLWNIVSLRGPFGSGSYTPFKFPQINLIGVELGTPTQTLDKAWIERWPGALTSPVNLYEAQLQHRKGGAGTPPPPPVVPADTDGDGLTDAQERTVYHTDPTQADTDGDGLRDGAEATFWGSAWAADADSDGLSNLLDADADNDGVMDGAERQHGTDPAKPPTVPAPGKVHLWLEAEAATSLKAPMVVATDAGASGGKYLWVPEGQGRLASGGAALYRFTVPVAGTYVVWGRVLANGGTNDSFNVGMDTATPVVWWVRNGVTWGWDDAMRFTLAAGTHTLHITQREDGTKLDRLLITNDLAYTPPAESLTPPAPGKVHLWLEAEAATSLKAPMVVATDAGASGGKYLWVPEGQGRLASGGAALYRFTVPVAGTYVVWGRVLANGGTNDSFNVGMDTATPVVWWVRNGVTWGWDDAMRFTLAAGTHTLHITQREDGTKLDRLLITNDLAYTPN